MKTKRWKPKEGQIYYFVFVSIRPPVGIDALKSENDSFDSEAYKSYNCFKTKRQAKNVARKIKKLLREER